jgi:hypothetical protein
MLHYTGLRNRKIHSDLKMLKIFTLTGLERGPFLHLQHYHPIYICILSTWPLHTTVVNYYTVFSLAARFNHTGHVRFDVFMAVTMTNAIFRDVAPCTFCVNRCFGGTYHLHLRGEWVLSTGGCLQPPAHAGSSLADFSTLKIEAIHSSETSVYTRCTWRHIPEDSILHTGHLRATSYF